MAKDKTKSGTHVQNTAPLEIVDAAVTPEIFSNKMFGIARNPVNQNWTVYCSTYDPATGKVSKPEAIVSDLDRSVINDEFKIKVADAGILG